MRLIKIKPDSNYFCDECSKKKDATVKIAFNYSDSIYLCDDHKKELGGLLTSEQNNGILGSREGGC